MGQSEQRCTLSIKFALQSVVPRSGLNGLVFSISNLLYRLILLSFLLAGFAHREQCQVQPVQFIQDAHQSGLVSDVPKKDHFSVI